MMVNPAMYKRGALLLIVIMTIVVAIILSNVILNMMLSQGRLSINELRRIQAKYASMAGINWAYQNLIRGNPLFIPAGNCVRNSLTDSDTTFPSSINSIDVYVASPGAVCINALGQQVTEPCSPPTGAEVCLSSVADYTYTP